ncbi:MAG TPA: P-loop NTPase fold protein [Candidatus Saccharibacteria bacterium]|nr:P-loop NTPase fold protein [Candidatus Saccharibacteria bacterium]
MTKAYHSDRPIETPNEDQFGRLSFARNVIKIISSFGIDENFVIGLYAKWGMGKTSTINLIQSELDSSKNLEGIYVNAWTLGGSTEKILWDILEKISYATTGTTTQSRLKKLGKSLDKLSKAELPFGIETDVDIIGEGHNETKLSSGKIANTIGYVGRILASGDAIKHAKEKVEGSIKAKGIKMVVFIDDIDRLSKDQIADIFRLISNIANYEGVTFVLAFDKEYVSAALEDQLPKRQKGDDYIEKIVQVPLHLPAIHRAVLDDVFTKKLQSVLAATDITIDEQEIGRFQSLYFSSKLNSYINSPRAINKMMNVLHSVLPINHHEANTVDSIAIEIIRVFDEEFYQKIRDNKELLIAERSDSSYSRADDKNSERIQRITKIFGTDNEQRLIIIKDLFPQVQSLMHSFGGEDGSDLRQAQRIASNNYFDIFFSNFDESYGVSDKRILDILSHAQDKDDIDRGLSIINEKNFMAAMQTINDNHDKTANRLDFAKSLLDIASRLPDKTSALSLSPLDKVLFTIDDIFRKSETKLAYYIDLLRYNFELDRIESLPDLIRQVVLYSQEERSRGEPILNESDLATYKEAALDIIHKVAAADKMPLNATDGHAYIYSYWADFGTKSEVESYLKKHLKSADNVIDFISQFLGRWSSLTANSGYYRSDLNEATYKMIGQYIDQKYFYDIIVKNKEYSALKNIAANSVKYLDRHRSGYDDSMVELSRVGNEHTAKFREVIAGQFIYLHETLQSSVSETQEMTG